MPKNISLPHLLKTLRRVTLYLVDRSPPSALMRRQSPLGFESGPEGNGPKKRELRFFIYIRSRTKPISRSIPKYSSEPFVIL
jgi:hypothetical protein